MEKVLLLDIRHASISPTRNSKRVVEYCLKSLLVKSITIRLQTIALINYFIYKKVTDEGVITLHFTQTKVIELLLRPTTL